MQPFSKEIEETYKIRGENITIKAAAMFDANTGKQIYDEKLDSDAINKAFDIYRKKHNIIDPNRICYSLRSKSYNYSCL